MQLMGITVDKSLNAFQEAWSKPGVLNDILKELDKQHAIRVWIRDMCKYYNLDSDPIEQLSNAQNVIEAFIKSQKSSESKNINNGDMDTGSDSESSSEWKKSLDEKNPFKEWDLKVKPEKKIQFRYLCYSILALMELAKHSVTKEDEDILLAYLEKNKYFSLQSLEIKLSNSGYPALYCGKQIVEPLQAAKHSSFSALVTMAEYPDTGFLGITKEGKLVNASAFVIPALEKRPVKVLINQMCYVILLEDGSLVHNLRFSETPSIPVRDVSLLRDRMEWTPM